MSCKTFSLNTHLEIKWKQETQRRFPYNLNKTENIHTRKLDKPTHRMGLVRTKSLRPSVVLQGRESHNYQLTSLLYLQRQNMIQPSNALSIWKPMQLLWVRAPSVDERNAGLSHNSRLNTSPIVLGCNWILTHGKGLSYWKCIEYHNISPNRSLKSMPSLVEIP